jgi:hypothetical protein
MSVKPSNCTPQVKDRLLVSPLIDFSASSAAVYFPQVDPDNDWEVVDIQLKITLGYIASQAVTVEAGMDLGPSGSADTDRHALQQSLGTAVIAAGQLVKLTLTGVKILPKGHRLSVNHTQNASQTGEAIAVARLRPRDKDRGNTSKRPGASAQSAT